MNKNDFNYVLDALGDVMRLANFNRSIEHVACIYEEMGKDDRSQIDIAELMIQARDNSHYIFNKIDEVMLFLHDKSLTPEEKKLLNQMFDNKEV